MDASEGLRRVAVVIKWAGHLLAIPLLLGAAWNLLFEKYSSYDENFRVAAMCVASAVVVWVIALPIAWIIDGFSKRPSSRQP